MIAPHGRLRRTSCACLEWYDFEGHTEDFRDLLGEFAIVAQFITRAPEAAADDLFAKKLRHERSQPDDVRHCAAVPSLREHPHADDAVDVAAGRMKRAAELLCQLFKAFRIDRRSLLVSRPRNLTDGVQREAHPP